tara:strand:+ start:392 stop:574 length:183 start_codon:yes stop_codon:yes gene_type:complete
MKKFNVKKWLPLLIALIALLYSVGLGLTGETAEAQYSAHWSSTLILFYLLIDKIKNTEIQ